MRPTSVSATVSPGGTVTLTFEDKSSMAVLNLNWHLTQATIRELQEVTTRAEPSRSGAEGT